MAVIWIVNQYALPLAQGHNARHNQFARLLSERGHDVTLIRAKNHHLVNSSSPHVDSCSFKVHLISTPSYHSAHDRRRIFSWFSFAWQIARMDKNAHPKPDVVWISSPSLISFLGAQWLAKRTGARLVFEVRDIWPKTLISLGRYSKNHPFIMFLRWIENRALKQSDHIITTMPGGPDYVALKTNKINKATWIPNAISLSMVKATQTQTGIEGPKINFSKDRFLVGYTGTLGLANSVDTIIDAAITLKDNPSIGFVVMGAGRLEEQLKKHVECNQLTNVQFITHRSEAEVFSVLARLEAALLCWQDSPLYEFGTSANKMPTYMAAGKPILQAYSGGYDPVTSQKLGITVPAENGKALAQAILSLQSMRPETRSELAANSRKYAYNFYVFEKWVDRLEKILLFEQ